MRSILRRSDSSRWEGALMPPAPDLLSSVLGHSSFLKVPHKVQRACYNPVADLLQSCDKEERVFARGPHLGLRRQKRPLVSRLRAGLCLLLEANCSAPAPISPSMPGPAMRRAMKTTFQAAVAPL